LGKLLKLRIPVLVGYDDDVMGRFKRARKWRVSRLTFLSNLWWEYLDWTKEARTVVDQVTGGRPSPGMRALLTFVDQFISVTRYCGTYHLEVSGGARGYI
jgi:hypothetical protein